MKNKHPHAAVVLALGLAMAGLHLADLLLWSGADTGFAAAGSVWLRYIPWLAAFALPYLPARRAAAQPAGLQDTNKPLGVCMALAGAALLASGVAAGNAARYAILYPEVLSGSYPVWAAWADLLLPIFAGAWLLNYAVRAFGGFGLQRQRLGSSLLAGAVPLVFLWRLIWRFQFAPASLCRMPCTLRVLSAAAALLLVNPLMTVLRVDPAAWAETRTYLLVVCAGLVGSIGYNLNAGILGGMGNSSTTLLFLAVSTILNIFLDLALVLAVPLGVLGVALGTVIAQLCSWLFGIWYINRRYPQLAIHPFNGIFDRKLFCEIIRIGLPSGIQMSLVALGAMGVLSKVNSYGKAFTAGFNVGNKLDTLSFLPVQSLAAAVISFVGQNMGASREDRVRQGVRITVTMAVVWTVLSSALVVWLSVPLSRIFSPDPAVIAASARYLQCVMPPYVLFAILFVLNSAMRGAGDSLYPMVNVVASVILLRVPFLYLLANRFGPDAMYWSYGIGWAVACALSVYHYAAGKWRGKYRSE